MCASSYMRRHCTALWVSLTKTTSHFDPIVFRACSEPIFGVTFSSELQQRPLPVLRIEIVILLLMPLLELQVPVITHHVLIAALTILAFRHLLCLNCHRALFGLNSYQVLIHLNSCRALGPRSYRSSSSISSAFPLCTFRIFSTTFSSFFVVLILPRSASSGTRSYNSE